jgi:hypothetical protein
MLSFIPLQYCLKQPRARTTITLLHFAIIYYRVAAAGSLGSATELVNHGEEIIRL